MAVKRVGVQTEGAGERCAGVPSTIVRDEDREKLMRINGKRYTGAVIVRDAGGNMCHVRAA